MAVWLNYTPKPSRPGARCIQKPVSVKCAGETSARLLGERAVEEGRTDSYRITSEPLHSPKGR